MRFLGASAKSASVGGGITQRPSPTGQRYREAYFDVYPGVWRHGDWITITDRGTCVITGRSDATLNRGGVRLGTAEIYAVVNQRATKTGS